MAHAVQTTVDLSKSVEILVSGPFGGGGFHSRNSRRRRAPRRGRGRGERRTRPLGPGAHLGPDAQLINHHGFLKA